MKYSIGFVMTILCVNLTMAQGTFWQKVFGASNGINLGRSVKQLKTGTIFFAGTNSDSITQNDFVLHKFDANGQYLWQKRFGTDNDDNVEYLNHSSDNNLVLIGFTNSSTDSDILFCKVDTLGNLLWKRISGEPNKNELLKYVVPTKDGGYVACGYTTQSDLQSNDMLVIKFDSNGNEQWRCEIGFSGNDYAQMIQQTSDGGYIVSGDSEQQTIDNYVVKFDAQGNQQWDLIIGDSNANGNQAVIENSTGDYILSGESTTSRGLFFDIFLAKVHKSGTLQWFKYIGASGSDAGFSIVEAPKNTYLFTGYSNSYDANKPVNIMLAKIDSAGTPMGVNYFSQPFLSIGYDLVQAKKGYLIAGSTGDFFCLLNVNDSSYTHQYGVLNIKKIEKNSVTNSIFPNPVSNQFHLKLFQPNSTRKVSIYNMLGACVYELMNPNQTELDFDVSKWPAGAYVASLITSEGNSDIPFIIQH